MTIARVPTTRRPASGVCSVRCRKRIERFSESTSIGNVALQEVRFAIQDATRDRQTEMVIRALRQFSLPHRLMDFNNLPETRFEDVKQVLRVATDRVGARLNRPKQQGHLPPDKRLQPSGR